MISARADALLVTGLVAILLEVFQRFLFGRGGRRRRPRPVLSIALIAGAAIMQLIGAEAYAPLEAGSPWALPMVIAGGALMLALILPSDTNLPSSRRHFIATLLGAGLLFAGGLRIPFIAIPGFGFHEIGIPSAFALTLLFVFLFVSMMEICAMLPIISSILAFAIGLTVFIHIGVNQTFPGQVLCGSLVGAVVGRMVAEIGIGKTRPPDKTEIMALGYFAAAAALATFVKSIALAGFILPLGVLTIILVTLAIHGFERTVILRASPRG